MTIIRTTKPLQPRRKNEFYETPPQLVEAALGLLPSRFMPKTVLDPGSGSGAWGKVAKEMWPGTRLIGIDPYYKRESWLEGVYDEWYQITYPRFAKYDHVDLIIGNPPYGDAWEEEQRRKQAEAKKRDRNYFKPERPINYPYADAEVFVRHSLNLLGSGGYLLFLLRLAFLESQKRGNGLWVDFPPLSVNVLVERPSFTGNGRTDETAYAVFIWEKNRYPDTLLDWLSWR